MRGRSGSRVGKAGGGHARTQQSRPPCMPNNPWCHPHPPTRTLIVGTTVRICLFKKSRKTFHSLFLRSSAHQGGVE